MEENMENLPVVAQAGVLNVEQVISRLALKQEIYKKVMQEGTHYGVIPGCAKPSLYKAGAEILCVTFGLTAEYDEPRIERLENGHREVTCTCRIKHGGEVLAECSGSCSTLESRYRWREAQRKCPVCGAAAIIRGKKEYGGGCLCFGKKGGCGAKFPDGAHEIEGQECGRIENPDIADQYNTVLKMAQKRPYVGATLMATAASDIFTQDVEDFPEFMAKKNEQTPPEVAPQDAPKAAPAQAAQFIYRFAPVKEMYQSMGAKDGKAAWIRAIKLHQVRID